MTNPDRIVFLDIDGPIISGILFGLAFDCSTRRSYMNTNALAYLRQLLMISKAKLVINSTHNDHLVDGRTIKDDLIRWGINIEYFHEQWKTVFPTNKQSFDAYPNPRKHGVVHWLKTYGTPNTVWVAFDDENFIDSHGMIQVSYEEGITQKEYRKALNVFNVHDNVLLTAF